MAALPAWAEPQLATLTRERFSDPGWIFERKLDGERCLGFAGPAGTRLMSRSQRDITSTFPEVARALAGQRHGDLVVDGELVAFDGKQTRFGRLQQRLGQAHPEESLLRKMLLSPDSPTGCGRPATRTGLTAAAGRNRTPPDQTPGRT
jgi:ATP-dependent DNA ligase